MNPASRNTIKLFYDVYSRLIELSLSNLMKIVIESSEKLTDSDLEEIVDVWNRKGSRIAV